MVVFSPYQHDSLSSFDAFVQADSNCKFWMQPPPTETIIINRIDDDQYETRYNDDQKHNISSVENVENAVEDEEIDIEKEEQNKYIHKSRRCELLHQYNEKPSFINYHYGHNELSLLQPSSSESNYQSISISNGEYSAPYNEACTNDSNYDEDYIDPTRNQCNNYYAKLKRFCGFSSTSSMTVHQGRIIVVLAAMIYGTNFATVKMLNNSDDNLDDGQILPPVSCSTALRFTIAAISVVIPIIVSSVCNMQRKRSKNSCEYLDGKLEANTANFFQQESSDWLEQICAILGGGEIGFWYCIGYIFQAWGLKSVDASKVRIRR
jgi:hypothetical protein